MINLLLSTSEAAILDDIEEVGFGELIDVLAETGTPCRKLTVDVKKAAFITALRRVKRFNKVIVHDSEPTAAEYFTVTENGRKCLKKMRF